MNGTEAESFSDGDHPMLRFPSAALNTARAGSIERQ